MQAFHDSMEIHFQILKGKGKLSELKIRKRGSNFFLSHSMAGEVVEDRGRLSPDVSCSVTWEYMFRMVLHTIWICNEILKYLHLLNM